MPKISLIPIPKGYRSQSEDTSPEIDFLQFQRWKQMSLTQKVKLIIDKIRFVVMGGFQTSI